jgi:branched-chain amino acid transport system substrate-binding protein
MNQDPFLIKLKNFSNKLLVAPGRLGEFSRNVGVLLVALFLFFAACSSPRRTIIEKTEFDLTPKTQTVTQTMPLEPEFIAPRAPWEIWSEKGFEGSILDQGDNFSRSGELSQALDSYRLAEQQSQSYQISEEAFLRRIGTMLKLGDAEGVLRDISVRLKIQRQDIKEVRPAVALVAAFAYWRLGQTDQAFAWFSHAYKRTNAASPGSIVAERSREEAFNLLRQLSQQQFNEVAEKWSNDEFVGQLVTKERMRRASGGLDGQRREPNWFIPETYSREASLQGLSTLGELPAARQDSSTTNNAPKLGVILPLTGRYAEHALRVKNGIELARKQTIVTSPIEVIYGDSAGDPTIAQSEYRRLVSEQQVSLVLGPMLSRSAELVADESRLAKVPFITFTKAMGITSGGSNVFRLGATVDNQVYELLNFAVNLKGAKRFAVFYPMDGKSNEFVNSFKEQLYALGGQLVTEQGYLGNDAQSIGNLISSLTASGTEAVFIPDGLEGAISIISSIKDSGLKDILILGPALWDDRAGIRGYGALLEGVSYVTPFNLNSNSLSVVEFVDNYRREFHAEPELLSAQGFDAGSIALKILDRPFISAFDVSQELGKVQSYRGVTGLLSVGANGEFLRRMSVISILNGEPVEVVSGGTSAELIKSGQEKESTQQNASY